MIMNKPVFLGLLILKLSKIVMHEFWYDQIKTKYGEIAEFCYMDTGSFILHIKTDDIYKEIAKDVEAKSDSLN